MKLYQLNHWRKLL